MSSLRYLSIALAAILWAVGGTFARTLLDRGASAVDLSAGRAWIAVVGVGLLVLLSNAKPKLRQAYPLVIAFGLALASVNFLYYSAIALLPVAVAIVIQYTAPALVVAWKAFTERRFPPARMVSALFLTLTGVVLISELWNVAFRGLVLNGLGLLEAIGSAIAFAAYILMGERLSRYYSSKQTVFLGFSVAGLFWVAAIVIRGSAPTLTDVTFVPGILFLGVFATILPFVLFLWGLKEVRAGVASIISTLEPVAATALAFIWLGQKLSPVQVSGGLLVLIGVGLVQSVRPPEIEVLAERSAVE